MEVLGAHQVALEPPTQRLQLLPLVGPAQVREAVAQSAPVAEHVVEAAVQHANLIELK